MRPGLLLSLLVAVRLSAQPYLVKDITTTPVLVSSFPSFLAAKGGTTYFEATTDGGNFTLWKSDGTPGGTTQVTWREIKRGSDTAFAGDKLIFNAFEGDRFHLFATDGTEAGTVKLKTLSKSSSFNVDASHLISAGTLVYFIGFTSPEGRELWRTDGTPEGTRIVADLIPGNTPALAPAILGTIGSTLIFSAPTATGRQLFRTDGTAEGTTSFGSGWGDIGITAGDRIMFSQQFDTTWDLRITDGTTAGTSTLHSGFQSTIGFYEPVAKGNSVYFRAVDASGEDAWVSDGTTAGTQPLKLGGRFVPVVAGNDVFIITYDLAKQSNPYSMWKTNGSPSSNTLIKTNFEFSAAGVLNGKLYYGDGRDLWRVDGNTPVKVATLTASGNGGLDHFIGQTGNILLFSSKDKAHGVELWGTDATGTRFVANIGVDKSESTTFTSMEALGDRAIFVTTANQKGTIWVSDGTDAGTIPIADIASFKPTVTVSAVVNGIYFVSTGDSLWRSDGTPAGTFRLAAMIDATKDLNTFARFGQRVVFEGVDETGKSPWISDGTIAGTRKIPGSTSMVNGVAIGDTLYFSGSDVAHGRQPWRTDGVTATMVANVNYLDSIPPRDFTELNGFIYFLANGTDVWRTDGTNTARIQGASGVNALLRAGPILFLIGSSGTAALGNDGTPVTFFDLRLDRPCTGSIFVDAGVTYWMTGSLWRSDGTSVGTYPLGSGVQICSRVGRWNNRMFFYGRVPPFRDVMWATDRTVAGTSPILNIGVDHGPHNDLVVAGSRLFFQTYDAISGNELWALPLSDSTRRRSSR